MLFNQNSMGGLNYQINNSLRFNIASTQSASRTPSVAGNRKTWTWSGWIKRGQLSPTTYYPGIFGGYVDANNRTELKFVIAPLEKFEFLIFTAGLISGQLVTTQFFRDPSAWYHIVLAVDTTQATAANRLKLYVDGAQVTSFTTATYPALNADTLVNSTNVHSLGRNQAAIDHFDGYMAEVNFIDGQALTPSSFGSTDSKSGQWIAKKYTGTYGTNGFYLNFSNGTSTTTLGADSSGNNNNYTLTNFTRTAGAADCWMKDVPSGNGGGPGLQPNSNYAVLNTFDKGSVMTVSNANLAVTLGSSITNTIKTTIGASTGKWYFEATISAGASGRVGITNANASKEVNAGGDINGYSYGAGGAKFNNGVQTAYGATYTTNDIVGCAFDLDNGTISFFKNGVDQGVAFTGINLGVEYFPSLGLPTAAGAYVINCGQRAFAYTPPTGFVALCTANLPASTIVKAQDYFNTVLYTGNGTASNVVAHNMSNAPDLVWVKSRSAVLDHGLFDSVRGFAIALSSNTTAAEISTAGVGGVGGTNITLGGDLKYNTNAATYAAWMWDAGTTTVTNTNGSVSAQVRANPTVGFSIVTYTGSGVTTTTGHGLGVAPKFIIMKNRSAVADWLVYTTVVDGSFDVFRLNTTAGKTDSTLSAPTSTVFSLGSGIENNTNGNNYVAYCWTEIAGFSRFGSYIGNGNADGTFVSTGFRPKFILIKCSTAIGNWIIWDSVRNTTNVVGEELYPNLPGAGVTAVDLDILANGFKLRNTTASFNTSAVTYIYMAFAENPFAQSNAR